MMINKSTVGDVTILAPEGSINIDTSRILKKELNGLIDTGRTAVLVDFSGVDFMTSTGLGVLVAFAKRVEQVTGKLTDIQRAARERPLYPQKRTSSAQERLGLKKQTFNVRFAPRSGHNCPGRWMSASDPKRTFRNLPQF